MCCPLARGGGGGGAVLAGAHVQLAGRLLGLARVCGAAAWFVLVCGLAMWWGLFGGCPRGCGDWAQPPRDWILRGGGGGGLVLSGGSFSFVACAGCDS